MSDFTQDCSASPELARLPQEILPGDSLPITFLVGAGISLDRPSSLPLAIPFIKPVLSSLISPSVAGAFYPDTGKPIVMPPPRFEFISQLIKEYLDPELNLLECYASEATSKEKNHREEERPFKSRPNFFHLALADFLLHGHYVFTTNFDNLIEDALNERHTSGRPPITTVFSSDDYSRTMNSLRNREHLEPAIYKLHGSLYRPWSDPPERCPETLGVTFDYIRYDQNKQAALRWALERADLYVMGYSGSDEFDILPMLAPAHAVDRRLLWIVHRKNMKNLRVFGGRNGPPLADFQPGDDTERAIKDRLHWFIKARRRSPDKMFLVLGQTRLIMSAVYLDVFGKFPEELKQAYKMARHRNKNLSFLTKLYIKRWARQTIATDALCAVLARLAATEFMWVQNVEKFYDRASADLREAITKTDGDLRRIASAVADKYEGWARWFRGDYRKAGRRAERAQRALTSLRPKWVNLIKERKPIGEFALEALFDANSLRLETHYLLHKREAVRRVVHEVDRLAKAFPIKYRSHRVKKAWADILTVRANEAYSAGRLLEGLALYRRGRREYRSIGERQWLAYAWGGVADFYRVAGHFDRALKKYREGYEPIRILGGTWFEAWFQTATIDLQRFYPSRNIIIHWKPQYSEWEILPAVNRLMKDIKQSADVQALALAYRWRGDLARQREDFKCAKEDYERSFAYFKREGTPGGQHATRLCQLALQVQQQRCTTREVEAFRAECRRNGLRLEAAHCDLILAEMERLRHGEGRRFQECVKAYKVLSCAWGEMMSLLGLELGGMKGRRDKSVVKAMQFAKDRGLKWASPWIKRFEAEGYLEFYFPLFN